MKDHEATVGLIKHVSKRIDEFFEEYDYGEFANLPELQMGFARWLRHKEGPTKLKRGEGMIGEQVFAEDVVNEHSATLGFIKVMEDAHVGIMWSPLLFIEGSMMPDALREMLIEVLRMHATKLEDRTLDQRMRECAGKMTGTA